MLCRDPNRIISSETQPKTQESSQVENEQAVGDAVEYNSEGDEILSKAKCKSEWWNNFQKIKVKGTGAIKARCMFCNKKLVGDDRSGTRHLADHSKSCLKRKLADSKQKILTPSFVMGEEKKANLQSYHFDPEVSRKQLAYMIIIHEYPLSMVEHGEFRKFCHGLQPAFKMISRATLKRDIFKIYDVEKLKIMRYMERIKGRISFTTDMWTSSNKKRGFMVITAHFINDNWKLENRIIRFFIIICVFVYFTTIITLIFYLYFNCFSLFYFNYLYCFILLSFVFLFV